MADDIREGDEVTQVDKEVGLHVLISDKLRTDIRMEVAQRGGSVKEFTAMVFEYWLIRNSNIERWKTAREEEARG